MMTITDPLFLLTTHRSGGTALARLFNVHPDIVVWGEHGGVINKLAELAEIIRRHPKLASPVERRGIPRFLEKKAQLTDFSPWLNPVEADGFAEHARALLAHWFGQGLKPGQRWGVKEIRYHSPETVRFLLLLYPNAKFVILRRSLAEQCVSIVLSKWTFTNLGPEAGKSEAEAARIIDDCAYALAAIDHNLGRVAHAYSEATMLVKYEEMTPANAELIDELFNFAGLPVSEEIRAAAAGMLEVKSGRTPKTRVLGHITKELAERLAPASVARAEEEIRKKGINMSRLRRKQGPGQYSFLLGDARMRQSPASTIF